MANYVFRYDFKEKRIYRNKGYLLDAFFFSQVDDTYIHTPEKRRANRVERLTFDFRMVVFQLLLGLIFINYIIIYSIGWLFRKFIRAMSTGFNYLMVQLIRFRFRLDEQ